MNTKLKKIARNYLEDGNQLATKFMQLRTYTFWNSEQGIEGIRRVLSENVDDLPAIFEFCDNLKRTLLMNAVEEKNLAALRLFVEAGADLEIPSMDARVTPLYVAAQNGRLDMVQLLVEAGADKDFAQPDTGNNILMMSIASPQANAQAILYLINQGAQCGAKVMNGAMRSAADFASVYDQPKVFLRLVQKGAFEDSEVPPLQLAAFHGGRKVVEACLDDAELRQPALDHRRDAIIEVAKSPDVRALILSVHTEQEVWDAFDSATDSGAKPRSKTDVCML